MTAAAVAPSCPALCLHCGLPVAVGGSSYFSSSSFSSSSFCCSGCEAVYTLLRHEHLDRYYSLRGSRGTPVAERREDRRDDKWLESVEERLRASDGPVRLVLDVQGLHCVGCVWLIEELFGRQADGQQIVVNPALGRVDLHVRPAFELRTFVRSVERFGYLFGPPVKRDRLASSDLVWRLGVCAAIAMNSMIFGISIYAGLDRGPLFTLFTTLNLVFGALAVAVGGSVFMRSAWLAVRQGVLHLDLPIAIGIALAFLGSVHSYLVHGSEAAYFDTLDVFISLMLLGRWLQERVVERNRAWLLESSGADALLARRIRDGRAEIVPCGELRQGDRLLVAPGDLVPVDGLLERGRASFSLDWIVGESAPRSCDAGEVIPAGAFAAGGEALVLQATTDFLHSPLRELLRSPERLSTDRARATPWWQRLARVYVIGVLSLAAAGFLGWLGATGDVSRALAVTTAVLIVTCPCAFGIATPLAYEMVQAGLRRRGLFVRRASFLDRAREVRRVVFDKTGTLTTGSLRLANPEAIGALSEEARDALYNLTARSSHPKSTAIRSELDGRARLDETAQVVEIPGRGLELAHHGARWRLGEPGWAATAGPAAGDVSLGVDGALVAGFRTTERLRQDAAHEIRELSDDGYEVWLLSGDSQARVDAAARSTGIPIERAVGQKSPRGKASFLDAHGAGETLFVGDGVNDTLALDHALAAGTPAVDRPFVPARADFFFVTPGLAPIRMALRSARALAQVVRADLGIALAYNALTVTLALAGRMSPLACAVLMPVSSLTTIAATVAWLSPRSRLWKS